MKHRASPILGVLVVVLLAACGKQAAFPAGSFVAGQSAVAGLTGAELDFSQDGTFTAESPKNLPIKGNYTTSGDQVTITQTEGGAESGQCIGIPGTYQWTFDGNVLKLTAVSDQCSIRRIGWTSVAWTRKP